MKVLITGGSGFIGFHLAKFHANKGDEIVILDNLFKAKEEIDLEINRAKEKLRKSVSELAIAGAEKILEKSVDSETNKDLLDKLAQEL